MAAPAHLSALEKAEQDKANNDAELKELGKKIEKVEARIEALLEHPESDQDAKVSFQKEKLAELRKKEATLTDENKTISASITRLRELEAQQGAVLSALRATNDALTSRLSQLEAQQGAVPGGTAAAGLACAVSVSGYESEDAPVTLDKTGKPKQLPASGLSVREGGLDLSLGFLGESKSFVPFGTVRRALSMAIDQLNDADADVLNTRSVLQDAVSTQRAIINTGEEKIIDGVQHSVMNQLWPDTADEVMRFKTDVVDPVLNITNKIDQSRRVRLVDSASNCLDFTVFVCEIKESKAHVIDGVSQAFLAGASAALQLLRNGIPLPDCVVPVMVHTGISELHGAVYLLAYSMPTFVATSKVLDLLSPQDLLLAAKHRVVAKAFAGTLIGALRALAPTARWVMNPPMVRPVLSRDLYYHKQNKTKIFGANGIDGIAATSFHELTVFEKLALDGVEGVCYPVGRLMKTPSATPRQWSPQLCTVYPRLVGYAPGFHKSREWVEMVAAVVHRLHLAGVVHVDLFPCNIMTKMTGDTYSDIMLIDFEASLFLNTDFVPAAAAIVINYNGFTPMYHPEFTPDVIAEVKFDLWFIAAFYLQVEDPGFDPEWWNCNVEDHEPLRKWFEKSTSAIMLRLTTLQLSNLNL